MRQPHSSSPAGVRCRRTARQAVEAVGRTSPDVVLMSVRMPVLDAIAATRERSRLRTTTRVLVLTTVGLGG